MPGCRARPHRSLDPFGAGVDDAAGDRAHEKIWIVDSGGKKRITTTTETEGIKIEPTRKVWLNDDGQVRFFRSIEELLRIIKKIGLGSEFGFNVKVQAIFTIEDYDIKDGGEQDFYRVILKKVPRREGANEKRTRRRK